MSFEQEWAQYKEAAQQKSVGTQLNAAPAADGGGGGGGGSGNGDETLIVRSEELGDIGNIAHDLYERLGKVESHNEQGLRTSLFDAGVAYTNAGLDLGGGILKVHDNIQTQLATLKEACAHVSNHLDYTKASHSTDEAKITTDMRDADKKQMTPSRINDYLR